MDAPPALLVLDALAGARVVVAFSGGVDSSVLLALAARACTTVHAVFFDSPLNPAADKQRAVLVARQLGIDLHVEQANPLSDPAITRNDKQRCYACKRANFSRLVAIKENLGFDMVVEGSNADDESDYRPGMRAVVELEIRSPLRDARMTKADVRAVARDLGLSNAEDPSNACLASRVVYNVPLSAGLLVMIDKAEHAIKEVLGVGVARARVHEGMVLRVELDPGELERVLGENPSTLLSLDGTLKALGFVKVSLDLGGYSTGSLNELS